MKNRTILYSSLLLLALFNPLLSMETPATTDIQQPSKESFIAKAALSASILATYILYQRHSISAQATTIMNNL